VNPHTGHAGCAECERSGAVLRCGGTWHNGVYTNATLHSVGIDVTINHAEPEQPVWARVVATCIVVGFVLWVLGLFWWVLGAAAALITVAMVVGGIRGEMVDAASKRAAERARLAEIAARADQQHAWVIAGDDRGVYGVAAHAMDSFRNVIGIGEA
jgi:hypothetical protein